MAAYLDLIENCESAIRAGKPQLVASQVARLNFARVPRQWRLPLARICRRAGLDPSAMKLLLSLVYPRKAKSESGATPSEFAEYAVLLTRAGALKEAFEIFDRVDPASAPSAYLYRAYAHYSRLEFESAVPLLESYVAHSEVDEYWKLVGSVNLAYGYVSTGKLAQASVLLDQILVSAVLGGYVRLQANCYELMTRLYVSEQKFDAAQAVLAKGIESSPADGSEQLLFKKWLAVLEAFNSQSVAPIEKIKSEFKERGEWVNVRDLDVLALKVEFSKERFEKLVFGTPYAEFRKRICSEVGTMPESSHFILGRDQSTCFDIQTGTINGREISDPGGKCHQLISTLLFDFYRPVQIGEICAELFPGERFDIESSPNRAHQVIHRTRDWLARENIPCDIVSSGGAYKLEINGAFSIRVPLERNPVDRNRQVLAKIRNSFQASEAFSSKDVRMKLGLSRTSFHRFCKWAVETGEFEKFGDSNDTRYRISQPEQFKRAG